MRIVREKDILQHSDEITHFGIKGMKWGVRRYQPYPKGKHGTFLGQSRDDDIIIKSGTNAYRVQDSKKASGAGQTYISIDKLDHLQYLQATSAMEGGVAVNCMLAGKNPYSVKLKIDNDLITPSYQRTMDAFVKTVSEVGVKEISKLVGDKDKTRAKDFVKNYRRKRIDKCRDEAYINFVGTFMQDSKAKTIFFNTLKNQGYNAIIDDWDAGLGDGFTKTPIIVFDKSKNLKQTNAVEITKKDQEYFRDIFFMGYVNKDKKTRAKWDKFAGTKTYREKFRDER